MGMGGRLLPGWATEVHDCLQARVPGAECRRATPATQNKGGLSLMLPSPHLF